MNYGKRYLWLIMTLILVTLVFSSAGCTAEEITAAADNVNFTTDNTSGIKLPPEVVQAYNNALTAPLNKAADEISDPDLATFTRNLIASYSLGKSQSTEQDAASLVPDFKKITKSAQDNVLREAGKKLKDKELSEFYDTFIKSIGVD